MTIFYGKNADGDYGFFDDTIHVEIPQGAVQITEEQHVALLEGQAHGKIITPDSKGKPVLADPPTPPLEDVKISMLSIIDSDAEVLRSLFITANPGQVGTYLMKYNDAVAFKNASYEGEVPILVQAEADATGSTVQEAADDIILQYTTWNTLAAHIEKARRAAKIAVTEATTAEAVSAAYQACTAAFDQIKQQAPASIN